MGRWPPCHHRAPEHAGCPPCGLRDLRNLIAHEITHTAMNHVRWRDDDHDERFNYYNKLILRHLVI